MSIEIPTDAIDCRSEEGITVGLIDALISIARIAAHRDLASLAVEQALLDFNNDEDLLKLRVQARIIEDRIARESW